MAFRIFRFFFGMANCAAEDKFMSECRSLTNICGNAVAAVVIAHMEGELDIKEWLPRWGNGFVLGNPKGKPWIFIWENYDLTATSLE